MTTKSINDRMGDGGFESVAVFRETNNVPDGMIDPNSNVIKLPFLISQSFTPVIRTAKNTTVDPNDDTDYVVMASITIPANTLGINSRLLLEAHWDISGATGTKSFGYYWNGNLFSAPGYTTQTGIWNVYDIFNQGSLTTQRVINSTPQYGITSTPNHLTYTENTALAVTINLACKFSVATPITETITLIGHSLWHKPGNDV